MKNKIRGRVLTGILAAALLCTAIPETAYAVEMPEEAVQVSEEETEDMAVTEEEQPETVEGISDNDSGKEESSSEGNDEGDVGEMDQAENKEMEPPSDEEIAEKTGSGYEETSPEKETACQLTSARAATETIAQLRTRFPAGEYWNRVDLSYNNPDGVTSKPCPNNHNTAPNTCNNYRGYAQCWGFAYRLAYGYYGSCPLDQGWSKSTDAASLDSLKAGDIIRYLNDGHTIWVTGVDGDKVTFVDCNSDYHCKIRWDAVTYKSTIKSTFTHKWSAPYAAAESTISQEHGGYWDEGFYPVIPDGDYHIVSALGDQWWLTNAGFSTENGGNVQLWEYDDMECDHHLYHFEFIPDGKGIGRGFYKVTNKHSGKCLDSEGGHEYLYNQQTGRRTNVWQWEDNGGGAQQWAINEIDGGDKGMLYTFYARCSGYVMDVEDGIAASGTNISMWKDNGSAAQQWRLIPWAPSIGRTIGDGEYQIVPYSADDKVVSVAGDSPKNGTNVELNSNKGDYRHTFDVKYEENGYYSIINKNSNLSLDVAGGPANRKESANIQLWMRDGNSSAQKWIIRESGNGYYNVISKCNGLYLEVQDGGEKDGCNIALRRPSDFNTYLKWKFVPYKKSKLELPTADIPSGTEVVAGTGISLSCSVEGASIYYTLDCTDPTRQSTLYTDPIAVTENVTVKAVAVKEGYLDSDVAVFTYTVKSDDPDDPNTPDDPDDPGTPNTPDDPNTPDTPDTPDTPGTPDPSPSEEPDRPEENVPKEDMPDNGIIPDGLWIAGLAEGRYYYTGKAIRPEVRVYDHKTLLKEKTDYTISYKNNTNAYGYGVSDSAFDAGKAPTIIVMGKGNYTGRETQTFMILPLDIGSPSFAADDMTVACKKGAQKPVPTLFWQDKKLKNNTDFTVAYYSGGNRVDSVKAAGRYDIEIGGKGNFGGTRRIGLTVTKDLKLMSKMTVEKIKSQVYTGNAITPALTVKDGWTKLTEGEHYTISYSRNTAAGTAYAVVTGIEKAGYSGTKRVSFKITGTSISKAVVTGLTGKEFIYGGVQLEPELSLGIKGKGDGVTTEIALTPGIDYTMIWQKNRDAGSATVIFTGKGAYTGTMKKTFKIKPFDIAANTEGRVEAKLLQAAVPYAKGGAKPEVTVTFRQSNGATQTLKEGKDYILSYNNNNAVNGGSDSKKIPTVTVKGKGNFKGTYRVNLTYQITARDIGELTLAAEDRTYQNKKNAFATKVKVTDLDGKVLSAGKDYKKVFTYVYKEETIVKNGTMENGGTTVRAAGATVEPGDIIPAGTILSVKVTATEGGNYTGTIAGEYRITLASISSASVSIPKQTYTGKPIELDKDQLTVRIKGVFINPSQYEIVPGSYKNNVKKGNASVTIRGVGNYGGTKTVKFAIKAKGFVWWK